MAATAELGIIIKLKDQASRALNATVKSVGALSGAVFALAASSAKIQPVSDAFGRLADSIGETSETMMGELRQSTSGMMSDFEIMQAANKLMAMGLAESADSAGELAHMATRLGMAMGSEAGPALENFTLMLANQSIPRLDTYGISSGKVRERILELMEATKSLTREEAFKIATLEQGRLALERVGEMGETAAGTMASLQSTVTNLKDQIGSALLPVLQALLEPLADLAEKYGPMVVQFVQELVDRFQELPEPLQQLVAGAMGLAAAFTGVSTVVAMLGPMIGGLSGAFTMLLGPVGLLAVAIAGMVAATNILMERFAAKEAALLTIQARLVETSDSYQQYVDLLAEQGIPKTQAMTEELYKLAAAHGDVAAKVAAIEQVEKMYKAYEILGDKVADYIAEQLETNELLRDTAVEMGHLTEIQALMIEDSIRAADAMEDLSDAAVDLAYSLQSTSLMAEEAARMIGDAWNTAVMEANDIALRGAMELISIQERLTSDVQSLYDRHHIEMAGLQIQAEQERLSLTATYETQRAALTAAGATDQLNILNKNYTDQMGQLKTFWGIKFTNTKGLYGIERQRLREQIKAKIAMQLIQKGLEIGIANDTAMQVYNAHMQWLDLLIKDSGSIWDAYLGQLAAAGLPADLIQNLRNGINAATDAAMGSIDALSEGAQASIDAMWTEFEAGEGILDDVTAGIGDLNDAIGDTGNATRAAIDPLKAAAATISGLASMVDRATEAFQKLADYGITMPQFEAGWDKLLPQIKKMITGLAELLGDVGEDDTVLTKLQAWAERMKAAASIIKDALGALSALAKGSGGWVDPKTVERMGKNLRGVFWAFNETLKWIWLDEEGLDHILTKLARWADRLKPFSSLIRDGLGVLRDLAKGVPGWIDPEVVRQMGYNLRAAFWAFNESLKWIWLDDKQLDHILTKLTRWAARLKPFASLIKDTLGVLRDLAKGIPSSNLSWEALVDLARNIRFMVAIFDKILDAITLAEGTTDAMADKFKAWAARLGPLASIVSDALSILRGLAEATVAGNVSWEALVDLARNIRFMAAIFDRILDAIAVTEDVTEAMAAKFQAWADRLSPLASIIRDALSILDALSEEFSVNIAGDLQAVAEALEGMVDDFNDWLAAVDFLDDGSDVMGQKLQAWAVRIGSVADMLTKGMKALTEAKAWKIVTDVSDQVDAFKKAWKYIIEEFEKLVKEVGYLLTDDVKKFALIMQDIADALLKATETLTAIAEYVQPADQAMEDFQEDYKELFGGFVTFVNGLEDTIESDIIKPWAEALAAFFAGLGDAVTVLLAIADYVSPSTQALLQFQLDYMLMFMNFIRFVKGQKDITATAVKAWAEALQAFFAGLGDAVTVLDSIRDYVTPSTGALLQFQLDYMLMFQNFINFVKGQKKITATAIKAWAEALGAFFAGLGDAAAVLESIQDYVTPSTGALLQFQLDYLNMFGNFVKFVKEQEKTIKAEIVKPWAETLQALFSGLKDAVAVLEGISDYVTPAGTALADFKADFLYIMQEFADWVAGLGAEIDVTVVKPWADAVASLFAGLKDAVAVLQGVGALFHPSQQKLDFFMGQVEAVFTRMSGFAAGLGADAIEITTLFGNALSALSTGLSSALSYITRIEEIANIDLAEGGTFDRALSKFMDAITIMMREFKGWIEQWFDTETAELVTSLGTVIGNMVTGLQSALTFLSNLVGTELPSMETLQGFCELIIETFRSLVEGLEETAPLIGPAIEAISLAMSLSLLPDPETWLAHGALYVSKLVEGLNSGMPALAAAVTRVNTMLAQIGNTGSPSMLPGAPSSMSPGSLAPAAAGGTVVNQNFSLAGATIRSDDDVRMLSQELARDIRRTVGIGR